MSYVTTKTAKWIVIAILFVAIAAIVLVVVAVVFVPACLGFGWRAGQALFDLVAGPAVAELKMAQRDKVFMAVEQARSNKGGIGE